MPGVHGRDEVDGLVPVDTNPLEVDGRGANRLYACWNRGAAW